MSHLNVTVRKHVTKVCTVPLTTDNGTTMTPMRRCHQRKWKRVILKRWKIGIEGWKVDHMDDSVPRVSWYLLYRTRGRGEMWAPCKRSMNHQDTLLILTISRVVLEDILWTLYSLIYLIPMCYCLCTVIQNQSYFSVRFYNGVIHDLMWKSCTDC